VASNSTISGNFAVAYGGGITSYGATLSNVTVTGNVAQAGSNYAGGIYAMTGYTHQMRNTIIAGNRSISVLGTVYTVLSDCGGPATITSLGYNLVGTNSNGMCHFSSTATDQYGTFLDPIDPLLAALVSDGGVGLVHPLITGGPAIDAGNPAAPGSGGDACLGTDQRGSTRPDGSYCDIGAYEG
jgi:hypothetical protein